MWHDGAGAKLRCVKLPSGVSRPQGGRPADARRNRSARCDDALPRRTDEPDMKEAANEAASHGVVLRRLEADGPGQLMDAIADRKQRQHREHDQQQPKFFQTHARRGLVGVRRDHEVSRFALKEGT